MSKEAEERKGVVQKATEWSPKQPWKRSGVLRFRSKGGLWRRVLRFQRPFKTTQTPKKHYVKHFRAVLKAIKHHSRLNYLSACVLAAHRCGFHCF